MRPRSGRSCALSQLLLVGLGEEEHGVNGVAISFAGLIGDSQIRVCFFCLGTVLKGHAGGGGGVGTPRK